ncbi:MAG: hypothetical protein RJA29_2199 [Pseudomonadota bacterium]
MEFFKIRRDIPFMRNALAFNAVSLITFLAAVFFLFSRGLHLSVEFTGGTLMEVAYSQPADLTQARNAIAALGYADVQVQNFGTARDVLIRLPAVKGVSSAQQSEKVLDALKQTDASAKLRRTEFVGPQVGDELAADGLKALAFVVVGIVLYLAFRFEWKFAVAAIIANLHDVIIILGFFAFFQWEFSLPVLAAVLAVLGYSVNESVVIFDRIRENFRRFRKMDTVGIIDNAITSTISRTIITHGCTQLMVLSMLLFGGATLHYFALALTIGILFGIYSSVFVAAAIAMWLGIRREDLIKHVKKRATRTIRTRAPWSKFRPLRQALSQRARGGPKFPTQGAAREWSIHAVLGMAQASQCATRSASSHNSSRMSASGSIPALQYVMSTMILRSSRDTGCWGTAMARSSTISRKCAGSTPADSRKLRKPKHWAPSRSCSWTE